jgi:hypothetical protein
MIAGRREKGIEWVQRGPYAVRVEVDVVYPDESPETPCLEPATLKLLDEIAERADLGDVSFLKSVGQVFSRVSA